MRGGPLHARVGRLAPLAGRLIWSGLCRIASRSGRGVMVLPVLEILGIGLLVLFLSR